MNKVKSFLNDSSTKFLLISFIITILSFIIAINNVRGTFSYNYQKNNFWKNLYQINITEEKENNLLNLESKLKNANVRGIYSMPIDSTLTDTSKNKVIMGSLVGVEDSKLPTIENKEITGRFFDNKEFMEGNPVAIIGKDISSRVYERGNKRYIKFDEFKTEYEVIGILEGNDYLGNFIFVPMKSLPSNILNNSTNKFNILISANNKISTFSKINKQYKTFQINEYRSKKLSQIIHDSINYEKEELKNFMLPVLIGMLSILIFSIFWVDSCKRKFLIFRILGANNLYIIKYVFLSVLLIGIIGLPITLFASFTGGNFISVDKVVVDKWTILLSFTMTFIIALIATIGSFMEIFKFKLSNSIK